MRCDTCHQSSNLPGAHMPPGNPKWGLPPPEQKMTFVGRSPAELCQIKDPSRMADARSNTLCTTSRMTI